MLRSLWGTLLAAALSLPLGSTLPASAVESSAPLNSSQQVVTAEQGYYQQPTIHGEQVIFCCEDDLWTVPASGGVARRLTATKGRCYLPRLSPDGNTVAFVCTEEGGPEMYVMPAGGGTARRLTSLGAGRLDVCGWTPDGERIVFATNAESPVGRAAQLFTIPAAGGSPQRLNLGDAVSASINDRGGIAIGRNSSDPARWKRYHGGTAGELWVGASLESDFKPLISLNGNPVWPMWLGDRVFFLSDHEGVGNIYSCLADGSGLQRHTNELEYYARFPSTDGKRIVYAAGAQLRVLDPASNSVNKLSVSVPSNPTQAKRRFVETKDFLEGYTVHPKGHSLLLIARGQPYTMPLWEAAVANHGSGSKVRYQLPDWMSDGERFAVVNDAPGYQQIEVHRLDESSPAQAITSGDIGHVVALSVAPETDKIAFSNHRHDLWLIDPSDKQLRKIDSSPAAQISGLSWSADGRWLAYEFSPHENSRIIKVADAETGETHNVTSELRWDWGPNFDPEGKYLYFLSTRDFHPVEDEASFDLGFPMATRPFIVTLRKDVPSPLVPQVRPFVKPKDEEDKKKVAETAGRKADRISIDFDGITGRVLGLPVDESNYGQVAGLRGKVIYTRLPVKPVRPDSSWLKTEAPQGTLLVYDFEEQKESPLQKDVEDFSLGADHQTLAYKSKKRLRIIDAGKKPEESSSKKSADDEPGRESGWLDLSRVKAMVQPSDEWSQMFGEAWRLQKENFWDEKMSKVDWNLARDRYQVLLPRVKTRSELSDLIWEMQGESGTSHTYELLGDYREPDSYQRGFLGANLSFDTKSGGYRIDKILRGDSWDSDVDSPLSEPGLNIHEGDIIAAVGGLPVSRHLSVNELLVNTAGQRVQLTVIGGTSVKLRQVAVKTLKSETRLRYRAWVEANRKIVHDRSQGQLGYLHIPDMGTVGFSEFHRGFLSEYRYPGLVVDIRYNGGGSVSSLLLEKLMRKRIGYDVSRWGLPEPYPQESVAGPMVAVTNQFAGSDGDIFSHAFKQYKLGPLIGKRTWGGVIGIWPRCRLVDGTVTTQPEFSFWFSDVGWAVENHGVDPDYVVEITPQDYKAGRDPQLAKAIELGLAALKEHPVAMPKFDQRPSKELPEALHKPSGQED